MDSPSHVSVRVSSARTPTPATPVSTPTAPPTTPSRGLKRLALFVIVIIGAYFYSVNVPTHGRETGVARWARRSSNVTSTQDAALLEKLAAAELQAATDAAMIKELRGTLDGMRAMQQAVSAKEEVLEEPRSPQQDVLRVAPPFTIDAAPKSWMDAAGVPLPSTIECAMGVDGGDLCVYDNVCIDVPDAMDGAKNLELILLGDSTDAELESGTAQAGGARYARMRERWPRWSVRTLAIEGWRGAYSWDYEDILAARPGSYARALPISTRMTVSAHSPRAALSSSFGGDFDGDVVWTDSVWIASSVLGAHLWGFGASVGTPLVSSFVANFSGAIAPGLPPLRTLLIGPAEGDEQTIRAAALGQPFVSEFSPNGWAWAFGFLESSLRFLLGAPPFLGSARALNHAPGDAEVRASAAGQLAVDRRATFDTFLRALKAGNSLNCDGPSATSGNGPCALVLSSLFAFWRARETANSLADIAPSAPQWTDTGNVDRVVRERLSACTNIASDIGGVSSPFAAPPADGGAFKAFIVSPNLGEGPEREFSRAIWCAVAALTRKQVEGAYLDLRAEDHFFSDVGLGASRDAQPQSRGAPVLPSRDAPHAARLVFSIEDLPASPVTTTVMSWALERADDILGEMPREDWVRAVRDADAVDMGAAWTRPIVAAAPGDASLALLRSTPLLAALGAWLEHRRTRLCAKSAVVLGPKETLVGGTAEAQLYREWGARARDVEGPDVPALFPPVTDERGEAVPPGVAVGAAPKTPAQVPILLLDRGAESNGITTAGHYGRRFHNRDAMEAVLKKYDLQYTLVEDAELRALSFDAHAGLFNAHRILIVAHSAGMSNALFMPPRSAIIEVSSAGMWCPIYSRALSAAGHHVFPIYSNMIAPQQDYALSYGYSNYVSKVQEFRDRCETRGHVLASLDGECWHEARGVPVFTPIHEFEAALLLALDAAGTPRLHRNSAIHRLHGVVGEAELPTLPLLAHQDKDFYRLRAATLVDVPPAEDDALWTWSGGGEWPRHELADGEEKPSISDWAPQWMRDASAGGGEGSAQSVA